MRFLTLIGALVALIVSPAMAQTEQTGEAAAPTDSKIEVMVLGVYHFANPGLDMANTEVDDVLAPRRQREIAVLVDTLAEWQPTRIAVEDEAQAPALVLPAYEDAASLLETRRNESVQIGFRLAMQLGHTQVYGFDERGGEGEPDYFPMDRVQAFAQEHGGMEVLGPLFAELQVLVAEQQAQLAEQSIAESLIVHNQPHIVHGMHDKLYYSMLAIGNGDDQPGAELNAYWYMRNAKMFAKIDMIAQPGDRVLVIAGSGHATWLQHFVERMPGYSLVEALPYIERAAERTEKAE